MRSRLADIILKIGLYYWSEFSVVGNGYGSQNFFLMYRDEIPFIALFPNPPILKTISPKNTVEKALAARHEAPDTIRKKNLTPLTESFDHNRIAFKNTFKQFLIIM
jgi:hypothetical protein